MPVVLSNCELAVHAREHPFERDERGYPVPSPSDAVTVRGPFPGAAKEQPDRSFKLRLDERCWPVRGGDLITDGERTWYAAYQPEPRLHEVPGIPDVDYVEVVATLDPPRVP